MKSIESAKYDHRLEERMELVVVLGRRRDHILEAPMLDLEGLAVLAADYEAANMPSMAADMRRRLEHYREREILKVW